MPAPVASAFRRLGETLRGFSVGQRTVAFIGVAVLVLGISALVAWAAKPTLTPLFSGLNGEDASAIVEQLRADGVSYEITNGGSTILVPEDVVYDARLTAAANGLPTSATGGYALLDQMGVTSSEFQQSVTYKRAMEGELAATIGALKGVSMASVHLAIPEETVFSEHKSPPTASVFVETAAGASLGDDQVQAIVHLTSAAIEGMSPEDVAVVDAGGTVLSAVGVGATGGVDQQASDYEQGVQLAVQTMLDRVLGVGNSSVAVSAKMSMESATRVEESFSAAEDVPPLRESVSTETYEGANTQTATGVLGPDNIAVPSGEDGENGNYNSESSVTNNAVNKVTETRKIPAGSITRQSVAVAVNETAAEGVSLANLTDLVASAAGISQDRGDVVTVEKMDFNVTGAADAQAALEAAHEAAESARFSELLRTGIITLGIVIPVILSLLLYARYSKRRRSDVLAQWEIDAYQKAHEIEATPEHDQLDAPALPPLLEDGRSEQPDSERTRAALSALAGRDPEKTANLLRGLMDEKAGA